MLREAVPVAQMAQQISDSPSAVSIVTAADIRAFGYRTLADVVNAACAVSTRLTIAAINTWAVVVLAHPRTTPGGSCC